MARLLITICLFNAMASQAQTDSVAIKTIDSLVKLRKQWLHTTSSGLVHKDMTDSVRNLKVTGFFENSRLVYFTWYDSFLGGCEPSAVFYLHHDSLVYAAYQLSDPDIRSSLPPTALHQLYFKDDRIVHKIFSFQWGMPRFCKDVLVIPDLLADYYRYKRLLQQQ
jgi:hypothetical protein